MERASKQLWLNTAPPQAFADVCYGGHYHRFVLLNERQNWEQRVGSLWRELHTAKRCKATILGWPIVLQKSLMMVKARSVARLT
jgi:hypothetical protein